MKAAWFMSKEEECMKQRDGGGRGREREREYCLLLSLLGNLASVCRCTNLYRTEKLRL